MYEDGEGIEVVLVFNVIGVGGGLYPNPPGPGDEDIETNYTKDPNDRHSLSTTKATRSKRV